MSAYIKFVLINYVLLYIIRARLSSSFFRYSGLTTLTRSIFLTADLIPHFTTATPFHFFTTVWTGGAFHTVTVICHITVGEHYSQGLTSLS